VRQIGWAHRDILPLMATTPELPHITALDEIDLQQKQALPRLRRMLLRIALDIAALAIGVAASVHFRDWMWFSRSGALITAIELTLVINKSRSVIVLDSVRTGIEGLRRANREVHEKWPEPDCHALESLLAKAEADLAEREARNRLSSVLGMSAMNDTASGFILFCSTLIWGFGDLLGHLRK
jgi:hypothetical protein